MTYQRSEVESLLHKIGHKLRSPLSLVIHSADAILMEGDNLTSSQAAEYARTIQKSATSVQNCIALIMELVQVESIPYERSPLDVNWSMRRAVERTQRLARQLQCQVTAVIPDKLPLVEGNTEKILLATRLLIEMMLRMSAHDVVIKASTMDGAVILSVQDVQRQDETDKRMPIGQLITEQGDGQAAIEMLIVRRIAEQHNGETWLTSDTDQNLVGLHLSLPIWMFQSAPLDKSVSTAVAAE